jgi:hypothetical protein
MVVLAAAIVLAGGGIAVWLRPQHRIVSPEIYEQIKLGMPMAEVEAIIEPFVGEEICFDDRVSWELLRSDGVAPEDNCWQRFSTFGGSSYVIELTWKAAIGSRTRA